MQTYFWKLQNNEQDAEVMQKAAALIQAGEVVAFPTETVYGLGANGLNSEAGTLCVALTTTNSGNRANWNNYKVLKSDGTIPADRLGDTTGLTAGNYRPRLTIDAQGNKTITWVAE